MSKNEWPLVILFLVFTAVLHQMLLFRVDWGLSFELILSESELDTFFDKGFFDDNN